MKSEITLNPNKWPLVLLFLLTTACSKSVSEEFMQECQINEDPEVCACLYDVFFEAVGRRGIKTILHDPENSKISAIAARRALLYCRQNAYDM